MCIKGRKSQALGLDVGSNPSLTSFCLDKCSNFFIYLFYFWLCWVFAVRGLFSNCGEQGLHSSFSVQASRCGGSSCCGAQALGHRGSRAHRL